MNASREHISIVVNDASGDECFFSLVFDGDTVEVFKGDMDGRSFYPRFSCDWVHMRQLMVRAIEIWPAND